MSLTICNITFLDWIVVRLLPRSIRSIWIYDYINDSIIRNIIKVRLCGFRDGLFYTLLETTYIYIPLCATIRHAFQQKFPICLSSQLFNHVSECYFFTNKVFWHAFKSTFRYFFQYNILARLLYLSDTLFDETFQQLLPRFSRLLLSCQQLFSKNILKSHIERCVKKLHHNSCWNSYPKTCQKASLKGVPESSPKGIS